LKWSSFLRSIPGLRSRFPIHLEFPDYAWRNSFRSPTSCCGKGTTDLPRRIRTLERIIRDKTVEEDGACQRAARPQLH
jgi:hypothetical protein